MNKCYFTGHTTKDMEIRYTQGNKAVTRFSLAVDTGYGDNKKTNFFNFVAWEKTAETLERLAKKGTKLLIECEAVQNDYTDKNGNKVNSIDFVVRNFEFCNNKNGQNGGQNASQAQPQPKPSGDEFMNVSIDDELPFQ